MVESPAGAAHAARERTWSLQGAIDALIAAATQAGAPGLIWIAGLAYPGWSLLELGYEREASWVWAVPLLLLALYLLLVLLRLSAGLARIAEPKEWARLCGGARATPRLRDAWEAGKGLTSGALGLYVLLVGMLTVVVAALVGVVKGLEHAFDAEPWVLALLLGVPLVLFLVAYGAVLLVVHHLALQSLVRNRRGVGSALVHAWRIARHDPLSTLWAALAELLLTLLVHFALILLGLVSLPALMLGVVLAMALRGFAGVARAAFWARAYRALGGLAPEDGVPGLGSAGGR